MKKKEIENKLYNVVGIDEFTDKPDLHNPKFTAIEDHGLVMPIRGRNDVGPGYYYQPDAMCCIVQKPENTDQYLPTGIIDYTNPSSIGDIIRNNELIKNIQADIMATPENILCLQVTDNDTPEMNAVKRAINLKQVDKGQYADRFTQFQNDMRLLKGNSITLAKLINICSAFDIEAELTLRDKEQDIPNPMNAEITVNLTEGRTDQK